MMTNETPTFNRMLHFNIQLNIKIFNCMLTAKCVYIYDYIN